MALLLYLFSILIYCRSLSYNPHIIGLIGYTTAESPALSIVTKLYKMSLHAFLSKEIAPLNPKLILRLATDISIGMEELHSKGVIHRNLTSGLYSVKISNDVDTFNIIDT